MPFVPPTLEELDYDPIKQVFVRYVAQNAEEAQQFAKALKIKDTEALIDALTTATKKSGFTPEFVVRSITSNKYTILPPEINPENTVAMYLKLLANLPVDNAAIFELLKPKSPNAKFWADCGVKNSLFSKNSVLSNAIVNPDRYINSVSGSVDNHPNPNINSVSESVDNTPNSVTGSDSALTPPDNTVRPYSPTRR